MTDPTRDALRGIWSAAAPAWAEHADFVDARAAPITQTMLELAAVHSGARVLELACGPGGTGLAAAEIVGASGEVVCSDVAAEMVAIVAERAKTRGLRNVKAVQFGMEEVPLPDASFDAVLCREGLMLVLDPAAAVREAHRVLVPGGRVAYSVWGPQDRNPWLGALFDALTASLGIPVPPPTMPGPFALSEYGRLEELLSEAGFREVSVHEVAAPMNASSFDEWWAVVPSLAGPVGPLMQAQPPKVSAAIRGEVSSALDRFRTDVGYDLPGLTFVGVGHH